MVTPTLSALKRPAFTMIELIFAIVIIGLVAITIPTILMSNARHTETNLLQEAVLIAAAKMGQNMSFPWDENSWDHNATLAKSDVIRVSAGDTELNRDTLDFRKGHFQEALRRRMTPQNNERNASTSLGPNGGDMDDLDDINGVTVQVTPPGGGIVGQGYKFTYNITGNVVYVSDAATYSNTTITYNYPTAGTGGTTNMKMVEIRVDATNTAPNPDILLRMYSSNIGETDYYKRTY